MHIALRLNLYRAAELTVPVDLVQAADDLGYHSVWSAEAYGTDALSPLAYLAGCTRRIKLGTAVVQLAARPPATLAMHAMTIDALAGGGRVIIGVGVSGPQIVEGWYGQPWGRPTDRLRDYMAIVRKVIDREAPVTHDGPGDLPPVPGAGIDRAGQGAALDPARLGPIPIWLASGGPRNTELCAELGDGWLPMGLGPDGAYGQAAGAGWAKRGRAAGRLRDLHRRVRRSSPTTWPERSTACARSPPCTSAAWAAPPTTSTATPWPGGASPTEAARIQELWLAGRKDEAVAAVPDEYLEQSAFIGTSSAYGGGGLPGRRRPAVTGLIVDAAGVEELPC